jgi:uncharacterized membrane protein
MTSRSRLLVLLFAAAGLAASVAALYVHYRVLTDVSYSSFCDISETVSCQQVFQSSYGSVLGVPVAAGGAIWSALVLLLAFFGMQPAQPASPKRSEGGDLAARVAGYIFLLATVGLAAVFYFAYASFVVLNQACPLCMAMYVSVIGVFAASAGAAGSLKRLPAQLGRDLAVLPRSQTAMTLAVAWLAASMTLVVLFPREQPFSAAEPGAASAAPAETLTAEQMLEWEQFLDSAPRVSELEPAGDAKVRLVKFNDYQCPYCRETWAAYRPLIAKYEASHPGVFVYESRDFPLEPECGLGGSHGMACEAAAAVRMARATNSEREMEIWLFEHQSFEMTRDEVKQGLLDVARISDFDEQYPAIVGEIRDDVQLALKLGVDGTPTFYVNGINIGAGLRPSYLDAAIEYELSKAGVDAQVAVDLQDR